MMIIIIISPQQPHPLQPALVVGNIVSVDHSVPRPVLEASPSSTGASPCAVGQLDAIVPMASMK